MDRIAIIKSNYTPYGGGEKYALRTVETFSRRGFKVDVLTSTQQEWPKNEGEVSYIYFPVIKINKFAELISFNSEINKYLAENWKTYKCILGMERTTLQTHIRAGGGCHKGWLERRKKYCSSLKNLSFMINPRHIAANILEEKAFKNPSVKRVFANSDMVREEIVKYYGVDERKIEVTHNGVEWEKFSESFEEAIERRHDLRRGMNLDPDKFHFLFVGSGFERKGLKKAIIALKELPEDVVLLVVGRDEKQQKYLRLSERLKMKGRVVFYGPRADVTTFYQIADAFVLPTIYDPFSNATLEALAMGLFTVTTTSNGCAEVMKDFAGAIIQDTGDIDAMVEAMSKGVRSDHPRRQIRESVKHLTFQKQLTKMVELCMKDMI
ncbi:MAG: glycosyltransferase family 4 protein [Syntrophobacterales bacterium]|nr:MAG: glycosyltransferase family 4 protein [Syntrophobacterales bacterium]